MTVPAPVLVAAGMPVPPIDVILPCLNEAASLPGLLAAMPAGYRPIVADNGSTDGSGALAASLGATVVDVPQRGFGAACHAGLLAATSEIVCVMDADGSFDPNDLYLVTTPLCDGTADLMLGRRAPRGFGAWPLHARIGNAVLSAELRRRAGVPLHDLGPMRAFRREALLGLGIVDRRFGYPLEMVMRAAAAGWRVAEVPVAYYPRSGGKSKVTGTVRGTVKAVRDMRKVLSEASASQGGFAAPSTPQRGGVPPFTPLPGGAGHNPPGPRASAPAGLGKAPAPGSRASALAGLGKAPAPGPRASAPAGLGEAPAPGSRASAPGGLGTTPAAPHPVGVA